MKEKLKNLKKHPLVAQLRDVRVVSLIGFTAIVLLVSWSTASVIQTNYDLQKQIAEMEEKNEVQRLKNENQRLKNQYFKTDQFLELQARKLFGKAAPGETLILVPKDVAMANVSPESQDSSESERQPAKPWYQRNFEAWMDYFLHRNG